MRLSNNLKNKTSSDTYWRIQLVWIKDQVQSSLERSLEHNLDMMPLTNQNSLWSFNQLRSRKNIFRVSRKYFSKQFYFIRCRTLHLQPVEKRRYNRFTYLENTINNSLKIPVANVLEVIHSCFISICKFDSFKNPLAMITSLCEL